MEDVNGKSLMTNVNGENEFETSREQQKRLKILLASDDSLTLTITVKS